MTDSLVPLQPQPYQFLMPRGMDAQRIWQTFMANKKPATRLQYSNAMRAFADWMHAVSAEDCIVKLLATGPGNANALVMEYKDVLSATLAPNTVNIRLAALRNVIKICNIMGIIQWHLNVPSVPVVAYRDTRGCGRDGYEKLLVEVLKNPRRYLAVRNTAILHLMFDCALRREEVASLGLEHYDRERPAVAIMGKKKTQREWFTVPPSVIKALDEYIVLRGQEPGSLFKIDGAMIWVMVTEAAKAAGIKAWPHAVRHAAITEALDVTHGDIRAVQRFSRHARPDTVLKYDDNRQDLAGEVARMVSEGKPLYVPPDKPTA